MIKKKLLLSVLIPVSIILLIAAVVFTCLFIRYDKRKGLALYQSGSNIVEKEKEGKTKKIIFSGKEYEVVYYRTQIALNHRFDGNLFWTKNRNDTSGIIDMYMDADSKYEIGFLYNSDNLCWFRPIKRNLDDGNGGVTADEAYEIALKFIEENRREKDRYVLRGSGQNKEGTYMFDFYYEIGNQETDERLEIHVSTYGDIIVMVERLYDKYSGVDIDEDLVTEAKRKLDERTEDIHVYDRPDQKCVSYNIDYEYLTRKVTGEYVIKREVSVSYDDMQVLSCFEQALE